MPFQELDRHEELFLLSIAEPEDNVLRLVVSEAGVVEDGPNGNINDRSRYALIAPHDGARTYEITFEDYVAYSVRNESFTVRDDDEIWSGRLSCVYERSRFLEYLRAATIASDDHPGPITHFGLNCANHIIDVAAVAAPTVRELEPRSAG